MANNYPRLSISPVKKKKEEECFIHINENPSKVRTVKTERALEQLKKSKVSNLKYILFI